MVSQTLYFSGGQSFEQNAGLLSSDTKLGQSAADSATRLPASLLPAARSRLQAPSSSTHFLEPGPWNLTQLPARTSRRNLSSQNSNEHRRRPSRGPEKP